VNDYDERTREIEEQAIAWAAVAVVCAIVVAVLLLVT
jgi:hypothetical protein